VLGKLLKRDIYRRLVYSNLPYFNQKQICLFLLMKLHSNVKSAKTTENFKSQVKWAVNARGVLKSRGLIFERWWVQRLKSRRLSSLFALVTLCATHWLSDYVAPSSLKIPVLAGWQQTGLKAWTGFDSIELTFSIKGLPKRFVTHAICNNAYVTGTHRWCWSDLHHVCCSINLKHDWNNRTSEIPCT
jgi:hypothetical protein